jgi:hypothetical protein
MKAVYWVEDCALTPLAFTSEENYLLIKEGQTAVANQAQFSLNDKPFFAFSVYRRSTHWFGR